MKRAAVGVLFSLLLLVIGSASAPASVGATGNCNIAGVLLKDQESSSGSWMLCWGVNEANMENPEPGQNIGPLDDGAFHSDFDTLTYRSGISYIMNFSDSGSFRLCMYSGTNYTGVLVYQTPSSPNPYGNWFVGRTFQTEYEPGSAKWVGGACPAPA